MGLGDRWQGRREERFYDKAKYEAVQARSGPDLSGFWVGGIIGSIVGIGILASDSDAAPIGFILLGLCGTLLQIAVIATGVSMGMRHRDAFNRQWGLNPPSAPVRQTDEPVET